MTNLPLSMRLADDWSYLSLGASPYYWDPATIYPRPLAIVPRSKHHLHALKKHGEIASKIGKDGFQVSMDVKNFKPCELTVKVIDNNSVVVEGRHEEREDDHGHIARHFIRRYALPEGYDANNVVSTLSSDGVLTVSVPKPQLEDRSNERLVQIQQVGPAHLNVKENPLFEEDKKEKTPPK